ncbi:MAG: hypothetical protein H7228_06410, partial [Polaromonas sp.]|nr:hypothetical protein [Polaromonas sp.]
MMPPPTNVPQATLVSESPELPDELTAMRAPKNPGHAWLALAIVFAIVLTLTSAWRQGWFTPT